MPNTRRFIDGTSGKSAIVFLRFACAGFVRRKKFDGAPESLLWRHHGSVTEQIFGELDIGEGMPDITGARRLMLDSRPNSQNLFKRLNQFVKGQPLTTTDVDHGAANRRRFNRKKVGFNHIVDIGKIT
jgi:hypothetical protein